MLLVYVPTVRSYMSLRQVFAEARRDLDRQMLARRFEVFAVRQAAEYFDVAVRGEDRSELQAVAQAARDSLDRLAAATTGTDTADVERLERAYSELQGLGRRYQTLPAGGSLDAGLKLFRDSAAVPRTEELQSLTDQILSEESAVFEDRLPAISGQLLLVPFAELESSAVRLRAAAAEATAAATFAQHLQRLVLEYQDFGFLHGAWHQLYLARGRAEQAYGVWLGEMVGSQAAEPATPELLTREVADRYRELNRLGDELVDASERSKTEAMSFYEARLEPLTDEQLSPALESVLDAYEAHLAVSLKSVSRRIDFAGWVLAAFGLVALMLALASPRLMSRWIVQPIGTLTRATRKLGTGDLSEQVVIQSTDELGELATCFNQMVVDLKEAQDRLGRRERLVVLGQLAGSVAHEIRNPLGVMKNSIYFLRLTQKLKDEKAMQHLGLIEDEITRANRIITELLDYARDPTSQIGQLVLQEAFYRALAEVEVPETIRVEHEFEDGPMDVTGDSGQIERILANFLRNAVQAMPDGGLLSMRCQPRGDLMVAEVEDSGIGIAEDEIVRIFEPLYTGKAKGIGLGLPLSQRYAQLNGGRIECESELGTGATFRLVLPAAKEQASAAS